MDLKDYTTEELRAELKRRRVQAMKEAKKQIPEYKEFTATVERVNNSYGSINRYVYKITDAKPHNCEIKSELFANISWRDFSLQKNTFNKATVPKIGDKVLLRYRKHKTCKTEIFDFTKAKIVEILERSNNE